MIAELADFLGGLTWRRASASLVLLLIAGLLLSFYESVTHTVELERAERALALASSAEQYKQQIGAAPSAEQLEIYRESVAAAHRAVVSAGPTVDLRSTYLKFLAAFLPWLLMAFVYIGGNDDGRLIGMFGALLVGVSVAAALTFAPEFLWPWGNLALLPVVPFALLMSFFWLMSRRKGKRGT